VDGESSRMKERQRSASLIFGPLCGSRHQHKSAGGTFRSSGGTNGLLCVCARAHARVCVREGREVPSVATKVERLRVGHIHGGEARHAPLHFAGTNRLAHLRERYMD
jgi:hypothetical protein